MTRVLHIWKIGTPRGFYKDPLANHGHDRREPPRQPLETEAGVPRRWTCVNPALWLVVAIPILIAPAVQADPAQDALNLVQPTHFAGAYDHATGAVLLTWQAPGDGAWSYELYRDGSFLAALTDQSYTDAATSQAASYYTLFAYGPNGELLVTSDLVRTTCPPISTWHEDDPPFVGFGIRDECMPIHP